MDLLVTFFLLLAAYLLMTFGCKGIYHLVVHWGTPRNRP